MKKGYFTLYSGLVILAMVIVSGCSPKNPPSTAQQQSSVQQQQQPQPSGEQSGSVKSQAPTDGKEVYNSYCADCHGTAGAGGSATALNKGFSSDKVADVVTKGKGSMPSYKGSLSDGQIKAVSDYVATLKK